MDGIGEIVSTPGPGDGAVDGTDVTEPELQIPLLQVSDVGIETHVRVSSCQVQPQPQLLRWRGHFEGFAFSHVPFH